MKWIQDESRVLSDRLRVSFAMDVAKAMAYLHSRGIIHRDLKTENLLVTENKRIKVCDFGFSRPSPTTAQETRRLSFCGTDSYMAPEIILCTPFDHRIDIFSYGIILCELAMNKIAEGSVLTRLIPGFGINHDEVLEAVAERVGWSGLDADIDPSDVSDNKHIARSPGIGVVMRGFLDVAFGCADDDPALRMEWKPVMKKLKGLEGDIIREEKELGILPEVPDEVSKPEENNRRASEYNRILQDLGPHSKTEETAEIGASNNTLNEFSLHSSKCVKKVGSGLQHEIPHKLEAVSGVHVLKLVLKGKKCEVCDGSFLRLGDSSKPLKCNECGAIYHIGCESSMPPSCGLPKSLRSSLFPTSNSKLNLSSNTTLQTLGKFNFFSGISDAKKSAAPLVFHAADGDHFATPEFREAVDPDIHPPTPPLKTRAIGSRKQSGRSSTSLSIGASLNRFSSAGSLENSEAKTYNYQFHDLHKNRVLGSTRTNLEQSEVMEGERKLKKREEFDSRQTLNLGKLGT
ncbi:UNVERIFIED_CONTAM: hypothetical protein HDU68_009050 [Siphonaria sp. JEL0065]|nr:hypothetical protein HDU68_009050 [Siphonaria sp. JEL0065]